MPACDDEHSEVGVPLPKSDEPHGASTHERSVRLPRTATGAIP
jgi:hypothetical protein